MNFYQINAFLNTSFGLDWLCWGT